MRPTMRSEEDKQHEKYLEICRLAGIKVDYCLITWAGEDHKRPEGCVSAKFCGDNLTFEMLAKASKLMGTTKIDIDCEHGCASDRCHETFITFRGAKGL